MWALSHTMQCFAHGGHSEDVALASGVTFWEHSSKIGFQFKVFQVHSYTVSMACDLVLSPKTAFPNWGVHTFMGKEAKL